MWVGVNVCVFMLWMCVLCVNVRTCLCVRMCVCVCLCACVRVIREERYILSKKWKGTKFWMFWSQRNPQCKKIGLLHSLQIICFFVLFKNVFILKLLFTYLWSVKLTIYSIFLAWQWHLINIKNVLIDLLIDQDGIICYHSKNIALFGLIMCLILFHNFVIES